MNPGDIYWAQPKSGIPHPYVVIRVDQDTVIACALTTNRRRVSMPGYVLLEAGEANLPKRSIVEVSKRFTLEHSQLGAYIGTLSQARLDQIQAGIQFLEKAFFPPDE